MFERIQEKEGCEKDGEEKRGFEQDARGKRLREWWIKEGDI
jgi:hypothetical protein